MDSAGKRARLPEALVRFSLARPRLVAAVWALAVCAGAWGALSLDIETTVDSVLDRTAHEWQFYQDSQEEFGGDEVIVVMVSSSIPYDASLIHRVSLLSEQLRAISGVRRVDSVATVPSIVEGPTGDLVFEAPAKLGDLNGRFAGLSPREVLEADPEAQGILVSSDGRAFALNVLLEQGAYWRSAAILDQIATIAGPEALLSGVPVFRRETNSRTEEELLALVPATAGLMFALLVLFFRSLTLALIPLLVSGISVVLVVGIMGVAGLPMTISTLILPTVLLALGCAYSMHMLSAAMAPSDAEVSMGARLAPVALPVALSGLTTAIGFVALSTVRIEALRQVGGLGGLGAIISTASVLTMLPALLSMIRLPSEGRLQTWLRNDGSVGLANFVPKHRCKIVLVFGVACVLSAVGVSRLRVESDVIQWFPVDDPLRVAYTQIRDELAGISPVNVVVEAADGVSIVSPTVLRSLGALTEYLEGLPLVSKATSIASPVARMHSVVSGSGSLESAEVAAVEQYLLILGSAEHLQDLINPARSRANVWVRAHSNASGDLLEVAGAAERWWRENGPPSTSATSTGIMFEFARAQRAISFGQLAGLGSALLAISLVLLLTFGSFRIAAVSLLPNVLPVLISFGVMGWLGLPLDAGTVLVGNLALGMAVDDTIHLVSALGRNERHVRGFELALRQALPPLVMTTAVLGAGFLVLGASSFVFIRNLGLLTALILVVCLFADLLLLPSFAVSDWTSRDASRLKGHL